MMAAARGGSITLALLVVSFLTVECASGVATSFFKAETFSDFSSGTPENVSIRSDGNVTLSPPLELRFESLEPYIWCVAVDGKGNIYAGAGEEGKVYRIRPDGKSDLIFDAPEGEILSLVADNSGRLYAGTGPGGIIYVIDDSGGKVLFDSDEDHIWCMTLDKNGDILAGTGSQGKLYRVKRDGKAEVILKSGEPNITAVAVHGGKIYAGTAGRGLLYVVEGSKSKVLFDTELMEVRSILFDQSGDIFMGCTGSGTEPVTVSRVRRRPGEQQEGGAQGENQPAEPLGSAVFRLAEDGLLKNLFPLQETLLCMEMLPNGDLVVGAAEEGRILRIDSRGRTAVLNKVDAAQVVSMAADGDLVLSTGDKGKIYSLKKAFAGSGEMTSPPYDAGPTSSWGVISWGAETPKGTSIELQTRSGNTRDPDESWSDWSKKYDEGGASKVTSPEARFIQWRAVLSTKDPAVTPMLRNVSIAYVQKNVKPFVVRLIVEGNAQPEGRPGQEGMGTAEGRGRHELRGILNASWESEDPNGDSLEYRIEFKEEGQKNWLTMKEGLTARSYTFDSQSLPDGKYTLMVTVTDSLTNPRGLALSDSSQSDPFTIDNTAPEIYRMGSDVKAGRKYRVTFQVEDQTTPLATCEYSVDASPWRPVFPIDQILDTRDESFVLETPSLSVGQHIVVVKVTDKAGNIGTKRLIIDAK
jgi:hypothetical protein